MGKSKSKCPILWLLSLILQACLSAAGSVHDLTTIKFSPSYIHDLIELQNTSVDVKVMLPKDEYMKSEFYDKPISLSVKTLHEGIASCDKSRMLLNASNFTDNNGTLVYEFQTNINGNFMGKTALQVRLISVPDNSTADSELLELDDGNQEFGVMLQPVKDAARMDLWVKREEGDTRMTKIFVSTLIILIAFANILMGCELDLTAVLSTIKSPIAPSIGCFTQFILMPLIAYSISHIVLIPRGLNSFALGLFVTGCSPGGGASNFWTLLLEGNVNLSITMTFLSTLASIAFIPLWMNLLGHKFLQGITTMKVKVPYRNIITGLIVLIIPLLIGVLIAKYLPRIAAKARKGLRPFIIFVLIFVITFGTLSNLYMFKLMTWPALLAGFLLPWCGFMFGCFSALILGQKPANVTAIAIETGVQNTGIAIMLLKFSFQQPDADISALIPVIVACFTPFPLLLGYGVHVFIKFIKNRRNLSSSSSDIEKDQTITFNVKTSTPFNIKSPTTSLSSSKVQDGSQQPLIRQNPNSSEESLTSEEEKIKYMEQVIEQVLLPGVVPE